MKRTSVETYIRYANRLGIEPSTAEQKELADLPQFYADMFGWEEKVVAVARVYHSLLPEEQKARAIFADNYGRCGAIDFFAEKYGLSKAIGRHNSYWIWGPRQYTGDLVLVLGGDIQGKTAVFNKVDVVDSVNTKYSMPYESSLRIYLCQGLKEPLEKFWQTLRYYD
jgi:hypothetical protein